MEEGGSEAQLVDVEEEKARGEVEDVTISEITTTATNETGTETHTGALATNDYSKAAQLR
jgi:hypothetical protein